WQFLLLVEMAIRPALLVFGSLLRSTPEEERIARRQDENGQNRGNQNTAHHRIGERPPEQSARDRDESQDSGHRGQHDWAEPAHGSADNGLPAVDTGRNILIDLVDEN